MDKPQRIGVVLTNIGTPDEPTPEAVRNYLEEFLSNRRVVRVNPVLWWFILHLFILPKRSVASAEKYASIWTDEGSPLLVYQDKLTEKVQAFLSKEGSSAEVLVRSAMSFGQPSVYDAFAELKDAGCTQLLVLPLYPQTAFATTKVAEDIAQEAYARLAWDVPYTFIAGYHLSPRYLDAISTSIQEAGFKCNSNDRLLFSLHSIPLSDIEKGDTYEQQIEATCLHIAETLGIARERWTIGYQSRFDNAQWLSPMTSDIAADWATGDDSRVFVVCPGFSVDCLETMYDIKQVLEPRFLQQRKRAGYSADPDQFHFVPCLNSSDAHLEVICDVLRPYLEG